MAEKMLAYLKSQPELWERLLEQKEQLARPFVQAMKENAAQYILMIGSGSSYNAACCVQALYADLLGIHAIPCFPTQADTLLKLCPPQHTLVLLVSQSGESTSTIQVAQKINDLGYRMLAVTQEVESSIAHACQAVIPLACGEETVGPKTKGYTATVLVLELMALALARALGKAPEADDVTAQLLRAFSLAPDTIAAGCAWSLANAEKLKAAPHILLLAEGSNLCAMREGALKLLETLYIPCTPYEFEEYLHGVQCTIAPGSHLILIVPDNRNRERMLRLADFNEAHGGVSYLITTGTPAGREGELFLHTSGSAYTSCYDVLLPLQAVSAIVSEKKGINCDQSKFPSFVHELATKNW